RSAARGFCRLAGRLARLARFGDARRADRFAGFFVLRLAALLFRAALRAGLREAWDFRAGRRDFRAAMSAPPTNSKPFDEEGYGPKMRPGTSGCKSGRRTR